LDAICRIREGGCKGQELRRLREQRAKLEQRLAFPRDKS
jgi:hypothetical protein